MRVLVQGDKSRHGCRDYPLSDVIENGHKNILFFNLSQVLNISRPLSCKWGACWGVCCRETTPYNSMLFEGYQNVRMQSVGDGELELKLETKLLELLEEYKQDGVNGEEKSVFRARKQKTRRYGRSWSVSDKLASRSQSSCPLCLFLSPFYSVHPLRVWLQGCIAIQLYSYVYNKMEFSSCIHNSKSQRV